MNWFRISGMALGMVLGTLMVQVPLLIIRPEYTLQQATANGCLGMALGLVFLAILRWVGVWR